MTAIDCNSIITTTNNNLDISTFNSTNTTKNTNETSNNTKIDDIHSIWSNQTNNLLIHQETKSPKWTAYFWQTAS